MIIFFLPMLEYELWGYFSYRTRFYLSGASMPALSLAMFNHKMILKICRRVNQCNSFYTGPDLGSEH